MNKVNKDIEDAQVLEQAPKDKEVKMNDYAHLVMFCGACNSRYILEENIPKDKGIQILLPPKSDSEMILVCKDCGNKMGLFYVEAAKKNDSESNDEKANESVQETSTIEESVV
jgi:hypothetical protein